eukprot:TRINITY_DN50906_c0_g1_i1.p1 TRINITY_DN50906_c0_g1~~TRINITY_DN50906_c0_g1_i1.p1  ORF type:complete len:1811 (+),score=602.93 TRINITY_DN50906_c0_g1_i1:133-5565(+)
MASLASDEDLTADSLSKTKELVLKLHELADTEEDAEERWTAELLACQQLRQEAQAAELRLQEVQHAAAQAQAAHAHSEEFLRRSEQEQLKQRHALRSLADSMAACKLRNSALESELSQYRSDAEMTQRRQQTPSGGELSQLQRQNADLAAALARARASEAEAQQMARTCELRAGGAGTSGGRSPEDVDGVRVRSLGLRLEVLEGVEMETARKLVFAEQALQAEGGSLSLFEQKYEAHAKALGAVREEANEVQAAQQRSCELLEKDAATLRQQLSSAEDALRSAAASDASMRPASQALDVGSSDNAAGAALQQLHEENMQLRAAYQRLQKEAAALEATDAGHLRYEVAGEAMPLTSGGSAVAAHGLQLVSPIPERSNATSTAETAREAQSHLPEASGGRKAAEDPRLASAMRRQEALAWELQVAHNTGIMQELELQKLRHECRRFGSSLDSSPAGASIAAPVPSTAAADVAASNADRSALSSELASEVESLRSYCQQLERQLAARASDHQPSMQEDGTAAEDLQQARASADELMEEVQRLRSVVCRQSAASPAAASQQAMVLKQELAEVQLERASLRTEMRAIELQPCQSPQLDEANTAAAELMEEVQRLRSVVCRQQAPAVAAQLQQELAAEQLESASWRREMTSMETELQRRFQEASSSNDELMEEVQHLRSVVRQQQPVSSAGQLPQELAAAQLECAKWRSEMLTMEKQLECFQANTAAHEAVVSGRQHAPAATQLQKELADAQMECANRQGKMITLEAELQRLQAEKALQEANAAALTVEAANLRESAASRTDDLKQECSRMGGELAELKSANLEVQEQRQQAARLLQERGKLHGEVEVMKMALEAARREEASEAQAQRSEVSELLGRCCRLQGEMEGMQESLQVARSKELAEAHQLQALQNGAPTICPETLWSPKVAAMLQENGALQAEVARLQAAARDAQEASELKLQDLALQAERALTDRAARASHDERSADPELREICSHLQSELQRMQKSLADATEQQASLTRFMQDSAQLQKELAGLVEKSHATSPRAGDSEFAELQREWAKLRSELVAAMAERPQARGLGAGASGDAAALLETVRHERVEGPADPAAARAMSRMQMQNLALNAEMTVMEAAVKTAQDERGVTAELRERCAHLQGELAAMQAAALSGADAQRSSLSSSLQDSAQLQKELAGLVEKFQSTGGRGDGSEFAEFQTEWAKLRTELVASIAELPKAMKPDATATPAASPSPALEAAPREVGELQADVVRLQADASDVRAMSRMRTQNIALNAEMAVMERAVKSADDERGAAVDLRERCACLQGELAAMQSALSGSDAQRSSLSTYMQENAQLRSELASCEEKLRQTGDSGRAGLAASQASPDVVPPASTAYAELQQALERNSNLHVEAQDQRKTSKQLLEESGRLRGEIEVMQAAAETARKEKAAESTAQRSEVAELVERCKELRSVVEGLQNTVQQAGSLQMQRSQQADQLPAVERHGAGKAAADDILSQKLVTVLQEHGQLQGEVARLQADALDMRKTSELRVHNMALHAEVAVMERAVRAADTEELQAERLALKRQTLELAKVSESLEKLRKESTSREQASTFDAATAEPEELRREKRYLLEKLQEANRATREAKKLAAAAREGGAGIPRKTHRVVSRRQNTNLVSRSIKAAQVGFEVQIFLSWARLASQGEKGSRRKKWQDKVDRLQEQLQEMRDKQIHLEGSVTRAEQQLSLKEKEADTSHTEILRLLGELDEARKKAKDIDLELAKVGTYLLGSTGGASTPRLSFSSKLGPAAKAELKNVLPRLEASRPKSGGPRAPPK